MFYNNNQLTTSEDLLKTKNVRLEKKKEQQSSLNLDLFYRYLGIQKDTEKIIQYFGSCFVDKSSIVDKNTEFFEKILEKEKSSLQKKMKDFENNLANLLKNNMLQNTTDDNKDIVITRNVSYDIIQAFQKVGDFHQKAGHPVESLLQSNIYKNNHDLTQLRYDLAYDEFAETLIGLANNDPVEILDGLVDIYYIILGTLHVFGAKPLLPKNLHTDMGLVETMIGYTKSHNSKQVHKVLESLFIFLFVLEKLAYEYTDNFWTAFDNVHESNMSKFPNTEERAVCVINYYKAPPNQSVKIHIGLHYKKIGDYYVVYDERGKIVKDPNYKEANMKPFLRNNNIA